MKRSPSAAEGCQRLSQRQLERAGLISRGRAAQQRPARLEPEALKAASDWLGAYRRFWEEKFDDLDAYLKRLQEEGEKE